MDLIIRHSELLDYFINKLQISDQAGLSKSEKDKQDMIIFGILLLTSRLMPLELHIENEERDDKKFSTQELAKDEVREKLNHLKKLIMSFVKSGTYFVRKISAQALLPLLKFSDYISEVENCFT